MYYIYTVFIHSFILPIFCILFACAKVHPTNGAGTAVMKAMDRTVKRIVLDPGRKHIV
jgi:hypothetical protein